MKVFVVINEDRHADTEVTLFSTYEKALEWVTASLVEENPGDVKFREYEGYLYWVEYSPDSDHYAIVEKEVR